MTKFVCLRKKINSQYLLISFLKYHWNYTNVLLKKDKRSDTVTCNLKIEPVTVIREPRYKFMFVKMPLNWWSATPKNYNLQNYAKETQCCLLPYYFFFRNSKTFIYIFSVWKLFLITNWHKCLNIKSFYFENE